MKKFSQILALTIVMLGMNTTVTLAEQRSDDNSMVELKTVSCRKLLKLKDNEQEAAIMFFHGYMSGKKGELMVNTETLGNITDKVMEHCINNPDDTLFNTFQKYRN